VFDDEHYFGHCSVAEHDNYYLNFGRAHWMVCDECRIKWFIGENLFSSWRRQNQMIWNENSERLKEYETVEIKWLLVFFTPKDLKGVCSIANPNLNLFPVPGPAKNFFGDKIEKELFVPSQTYPPQIDCEKHKKISGTNPMVTSGDNQSCHTASDSHATF
jgi:hypothetical protein